MSNAQSTAAGLPPWVKEPFERMLEYIKEISRVLDISKKGIAGLRGMPRLVEAIANFEKLEKPESEFNDPKVLKRAREEAELATTEVDRGFPVLHAHGVIALWGALEVTVEDLLVAWLINKPEVLKGDAFSKIRILLADYEALDKDERMRLLIKELQRSVTAPYRQGVDRFESVLQVFGLGGAVTDPIKADIFELQHVRNVLVHRASVADKRLVQAYPWMGVRVGDRVSVDYASYVRYFEAGLGYITLIIRRARVHFGLEPTAASV